ncbi:hypothetical protein ACLMJK_009389 [Lecanora helva]
MAPVRLQKPILPARQQIRRALTPPRSKEYREEAEPGTPVYHLAPKIQRSKGTLPWTEKANPKLSRDIDTVVLDRSKKQQITALIEKFLEPSSPKFYADRGIPYRLGFPFEGPAGTGNSSLAFALPGKFHLSTYCLQLTEPDIHAEGLQHLLNNLPKRCTVLIEDLHAAEFSSSDDGISSTIVRSLSMSAILNAIDGVASPEDIIIIGTTNNSENVDRAILRSGRLRNKFTLTLATQEDAKAMFLQFYMPTQAGAPKSDLECAGIMPHIIELADQFAAQLPEMTYSAADI